MLERSFIVYDLNDCHRLNKFDDKKLLAAFKLHWIYIV